MSTEENKPTFRRYVDDDKVVTGGCAAPTVEITGIEIFRFTEGKVVESWDKIDQLGALAGQP